jgi:uncharacterized membrane protein
MDWGSFFLLFIAFLVLFLVIERTDSKRRVIPILTVLLALELARRYIWYRGIHTEGVSAFIAALVAIFLFWVMIGRYNHAGTSDNNIQVLGLDD